MRQGDHILVNSTSDSGIRQYITRPTPSEGEGTLAQATMQLTLVLPLPTLDVSRGTDVKWLGS